MAGDLPALADLDYTRDGLSLFIQVEDLDDVKARLFAEFPEDDESGE